MFKKNIIQETALFCVLSDISSGLWAIYWLYISSDVQTTKPDYLNFMLYIDIRNYLHLWFLSKEMHPVPWSTSSALSFVFFFKHITEMIIPENVCCDWVFIIYKESSNDRKQVDFFKSSNN